MVTSLWVDCNRQLAALATYSKLPLSLSGRVGGFGTAPSASHCGALFFTHGSSFLHEV